MIMLYLETFETAELAEFVCASRTFMLLDPAGMLAEMMLCTS
jgi:hypothetical protein